MVREAVDGLHVLHSEAEQKQDYWAACLVKKENLGFWKRIASTTRNPVLF